MAAWVFWSAVLLAGYTYLLYPLLLPFLARLFPSQSLPDARERAETFPSVACIIAAFNEEQHIAARIDNVLTQTYDPAKLMLYVGSDGSRDKTASLILERKCDRVQALIFDKNRGKATVLNDLVAASSEPILVFSDANTMFEPDAVARLVARFEEPDVGAVCGELKLLDSKGSNRDSVYWRIEQSLKRNEAELGGLLGANGAIYAVRRELYRPIPAGTIIDDFCIAMNVAASGWRLVYEPKAVAVEDTPDEISEEYHRRVRIGIGNYQTFFRHPEYLLRTNIATCFAYVSHKVLRWFTPHLMLAALAASAVLSLESRFYAGVLLLQLAVYGVAAVVWRFNLQRALPRLPAMAFFLLTLNWAFLVAFVRFILGQYSGSWRPTVRQSMNSGSTST